MARKIKLCKEEGCSNQQTTRNYCRLHYLKNWKQVRMEKKKKASRNLNRYIDNIMRQNPDGAVGALKNKLDHQDRFEQSLEEIFYNDSVREVMNDLGYREDLDQMIDIIKIDESF